jgi:MFS family permease
MTATGVGAVAAALYLATRRRPSAWAIPVGATMLGAGLLLAAAFPVYAVALPALAFAGFGAIWMAANGNTLIQATVPDELRGRVISVYTTVFAGSTPIGALFAGFLASRWGAVAALLVGGALTVAVGVTALAWLRRHRTIGTGQAEPVPTAASAAH